MTLTSSECEKPKVKLNQFAAASPCYAMKFNDDTAFAAIHLPIERQTLTELSRV